MVRAEHSKENINYDELRWSEKPLYCPDNQEITTESAVDKKCDNTDSKLEIPIGVETANTTLASIPINAKSTALLIVDVQPEYWSKAPSVQKDFPKFETSLKRTISLARQQKAKIIWVRADYRKSHSPWLAQFERLNNLANKGRKRSDTLVEIPFEPESNDVAWEDFAVPLSDEPVFAKSSWSSSSNTELMEILRVSGIDTVLVCGLITSVCVQHSAFGVFEAGYRTILVEDACADRGRARHEAALALYGGYMYELITSDTLGDTESINMLVS